MKIARIQRPETGYFFKANKLFNRHHAEIGQQISDQRRLTLDIGEVADLAQEEKTEQIIALDEALRRLESQRPRVARVVHLRFYAGLSVDETARTLGVSARTVNLDWAFARACYVGECPRLSRLIERSA